MAMRPSESSDDTAVPMEVARQIDENLKRLYGVSVADDLPPDLARLIASLRDKDMQADKGAGNP